MELARGIGALPFGQSRPFALLTSANILGGLFLTSLGAKLNSNPLLLTWSWREESALCPSGKVGHSLC
jgi:hypothetical protein